MQRIADITFHPSWWYKNAGIEFDEKFFFDAEYRIEEDVKNNEFVDIKDYLETPYVDTSSPISDLGYNSSQIINDFITDKAIKLFSFLGKFFS